ncbi:MAG: hypothetical protein HZB44_03095 [Actinobacteria bacterium]|nr:hypothetical protein [Actinomycetota bacterium]
MRKIAIIAAIVLSVVFILAFSATAFAASPHTGYAGTTDYCISCHDMHEASGDYVLTRESTVTGVCGTCHGLFGAAAPAGVTWSGGAPADMAGANPTASIKLAYKVNMSAMTGAQMDATPGHSLGVMYGGTVVRTSDAVPGGSATLKVMTSGQYGGFNNGLYGGETTSTFTGTKGLYCASCHTPHAESGQLIAGTKLLSALPNHSMGTAAADTLDFCISCHDKRDNVGVEKNHPSTYCLTCHANQAGESDFPHTSTNQRLLQLEPDALCVLCHTAGTLP